MGLYIFSPVSNFENATFQYKLEIHGHICRDTQTGVYVYEC